MTLCQDQMKANPFKESKDKQGSEKTWFLRLKNRDNFTEDQQKQLDLLVAITA